MVRVIRSLLTSVLLAVLALGLTACGGDDPDDAASTPAESTSSAASEEPTASESSTGRDPGSRPTTRASPHRCPATRARAATTATAAETTRVAATTPTTRRSSRRCGSRWPRSSTRRPRPQQKADRIVGGSDLAPVFEQFEQGSADSRLAFTVEDPEVEGRRATALVGATDRGRPFAEPARTPFVLADGEWRLERRTVCTFAELAGLSCP